MSYKAEYINHDQATEEEQEDFAFVFEDWGKVLRISNNGEVTYRHDRIEPEDRTFSRDYRWILAELEAAYRAGLRDAKEQSK